MKLCFIKHGDVVREWEDLRAGVEWSFPDGVVPYIQEFAEIARVNAALVISFGFVNKELVDGNKHLCVLGTQGRRKFRYWFSYVLSRYRLKAMIRSFKPDLSVVLTQNQALPLLVKYHRKYGGFVLPGLTGIPGAGQFRRLYKLERRSYLRSLCAPEVHVVLSRGYAPGRHMLNKLKILKEVWPFFPQYPVDRVSTRYPVEFQRDGKFRIFFVGRLDEEKGILDFIRIGHLLKSKIPNLHMVVIGDGAEMKPAKTLCENLHLEEVITFLGYRPTSSLFSYFSTGELLIIPNKSYTTEGICKVCIEGIIGGLIPIASRVGGLPDNIDDGETGFLVEPENLNIFADRVMRLYNDPELRRRMKTKAGVRRSFFLNPPDTLVSCVRRFVEQYICKDMINQNETQPLGR
jgi:glycosyltransferase involved in cell wall biosynthesis